MAAPIVKFELKLNGTDLKMDEARLLNVLYYQSIRGSAQYYIQCNDKDWSYYDDLYEADAELQMRIGVQYGKNTVWSPVQNLLVGSVQASYHPQVVNVTISGMDKGEKMFRNCSRKIWVKTKVSDIVSELAQENDLNTQIETTKEAGRASDAQKG